MPDRQAMHVDGRVQRSHVRFLVADVRIGTLLDQRGRLVVVGVDDRDDQRGRAVGIDEIQIGA